MHIRGSSQELASFRVVAPDLVSIVKPVASGHLLSHWRSSWHTGMRYGNTYKLNHKESGNKGSAELVLGDSTVLSAAGEGMPNLERSLLLSGGEPTGKSHAYSFQVRVLFHQCLCSRTCRLALAALKEGRVKDPYSRLSQSTICKAVRVSL